MKLMVLYNSGKATGPNIIFPEIPFFSFLLVVCSTYPSSFLIFACHEWKITEQSYPTPVGTELKNIEDIRAVLNCLIF